MAIIGVWTVPTIITHKKPLKTITKADFNDLFPAILCIQNDAKCLKTAYFALKMNTKDISKLTENSTKKLSN